MIHDFLLAHPDFDVTCKLDDCDWEIIHHVCYRQDQPDVDKILRLLLAHPSIDVNVCEGFGQSPLSLACNNDAVRAVEIMLADPRIDAALPDVNDHTPLWWASITGNLTIMKHLMASGKELRYVSTKPLRFDEAVISRRCISDEVISLLERFEHNPELTRYEVGSDIKTPMVYASGLFAVVVFMCDGLLKIRPIHPSFLPFFEKRLRFFRMMARLPMELQMIICLQAYGVSGRNNIPTKYSKPAFQHFAKKL